MWGEQGMRGRGGYRDVEPVPGLLGESRIERLKRAKEAKAERLGALPPVVGEMQDLKKVR